MSADNGVYILVTPARPIKRGNFYINQHGKFEFRVAHCQAIDNIDYSDLYVPLLFADSKVHESKEKALEEAVKIYETLDICEYGISSIEKDICFPNMTSEQAKIALDSYVTEDTAEPDVLTHSRTNTPTKQEVTECLKELHSTHGLGICFDTKTIAESLKCDPAVLFDADTDSGPLFELLQEGRVEGDYSSDKTLDFTGKSWRLCGGRMEWN